MNILTKTEARAMKEAIQIFVAMGSDCMIKVGRDYYAASVECKAGVITVKSGPAMQEVYSNFENFCAHYKV